LAARRVHAVRVVAGRSVSAWLLHGVCPCSSSCMRATPWVPWRLQGPGGGDQQELGRMTGRVRGGAPAPPMASAQLRRPGGRVGRLAAGRVSWSLAWVLALERERGGGFIQLVGQELWGLLARKLAVQSSLRADAGDTLGQRILLAALIHYARHSRVHPACWLRHARPPGGPRSVGLIFLSPIVGAIKDSSVSLAHFVNHASINDQSCRLRVPRFGLAAWR
jgi:hypothetical protein